MRVRTSRDRRPAGLLVLFLCLPLAVEAACETPLAYLVSAVGTVDIRSASSPKWRPADAGDTLCVGDAVRVGRNSQTIIRFEGDATNARLDQNTTLRILDQDQGSGGWGSGGWLNLELPHGVVNFLSRIKGRLRIATPFVNAHVEGTELMASVGANQAAFDLYEGRLRLSNPRGTLVLTGRQSARAARGEPPQLYLLLRPLDAVQWTLHFEPMLSALLASGPGGIDDRLRADFARALARLRGGDADGAFALVDAVPPARRDAGFHTLRAALYLVVGRVEEARSDLAAADASDPGHADARAVASIIALARNETEKAQGLAEEAVAAGPERPLSWLALSYARQAHFDLPAAEDAMREAVRLDPANGVLRARLAELLLARGDFDAGFAQAREAARAAPDLALVARTQGMAQLLRIDLAGAAEAFERALALDPADPFARLGLGLTLIRSGDLAAGREQLEIAVALAPRNALLRTYLGKAYYEEKQDRQAATAYDLAIEQDPRDPTPWLYRAILLRQNNRPVEALAAIERSIALNPNRGLFRPQATLEADEAARVATLGQVYRDLAFEQLALLKGWNAVAAAPDDHVGHRLLAEVYAVLPRHEEARVSELLQAQLLQPLSRLPVAPLSGQTRLLVPEGLAPSRPGLNELDSLFLRQGGSAWVTAQVGNQDTVGNEILASGLAGKTAFSLGQYHFETGGSGLIPPGDEDILVGFVQAQLTPATSVQAEVRWSQWQDGPFVDTVGAELRTLRDEESGSARLGAAHRFGPGSTLIASAVYQSDEQHQTQSSPPASTGPAIQSVGDTRITGGSVELRQDWRTTDFGVTLGGGYYEQDRNADLRVDTEIIPGLRMGESLDESARVQFAQAYVYGWWRPAARLDLNLGLSYEVLTQRTDRVAASTQSPAIGIGIGIGGAGPPAATAAAGDDEDELVRLNPKLGVSWRPTDRTTVRAAAFRTLRRSRLLKRTIEPTQVAGFNQFFDGPDGETAWRYGFGVDHRLSPGLFVGGEVSRRDVDPPAVVLDDGGTAFSARERFGRAYLYWTPSDRLALAGEYFYERQVIGDDGLDDRTHRVPLTLSWFHPSGVFANLRGSYLQQSAYWDGRELPRYTDVFWNWDLGVGYRLPQRSGVISVFVGNLFDVDLDYEPTDFNQPLFVSERTFALRASLRF